MRDLLSPNTITATVLWLAIVTSFYSFREWHKDNRGPGLLCALLAVILIRWFVERVAL